MLQRRESWDGCVVKLGGKKKKKWAYLGVFRGIALIDDELGEIHLRWIGQVNSAGEKKFLYAS